MLQSDCGIMSIGVYLLEDRPGISGGADGAVKGACVQIMARDKMDMSSVKEDNWSLYTYICGVSTGMNR